MHFFKEHIYLKWFIIKVIGETFDVNRALLKLVRWYNRVEALDCKFFNSVLTTMENHYGTITNYFVKRTINVAAESFNAKVKVFRSQFRGIRDISFLFSGYPNFVHEVDGSTWYVHRSHIWAFEISPL